MKKNQANRRRAALERLRNASFTDKGKRTEKEWKERVEQEIKTLEERTVADACREAKHSRPLQMVRRPN